jgi:hypothetical protein
MSSGTQGSTSSPHIEQIIGCANGVSWTQRVEINPSDLTTVQTLYVNNSTGATQITAPLSFAPIPCGSGKNADFTAHCDTGTTPPTPYIKREIVDFTATPPLTTIQNFALSGAAYTPTTEGVCDGYDLVEACADIINTANGAVTPVRSLQLTRYGQLVGTPIFYSLTSNTSIIPTGTERVVNCGDLNYTESVLCDASAPPVPFWRTQIKLGSSVLFTQNLNIEKTATYTPVGAVGLCQNYTTDDEYACISALTGNNGTIPIRIVRVYNGANLISETRTRLDTYALVANNAVLVPCTQAAGTVRQGSNVVTGGASVLVPAGKKSISIVVRSGSVTGTGSLQTGTAQYRAGESYSWSSDDAAGLLEAMTFTGSSPTTSYTLSWTQRL